MKKILLLISFIFITVFSVNANSENQNKVCSGFAKWTENGEFKQIRESKCMTEEEYKAYLNSPDYLCKYYVKSISLIHPRMANNFNCFNQFSFTLL